LKRGKFLGGEALDLRQLLGFSLCHCPILFEQREDPFGVGRYFE